MMKGLEEEAAGAEREQDVMTIIMTMTMSGRHGLWLNVAGLGYEFFSFYVYVRHILLLPTVMAMALPPL